jgi:hypothetical protein
MTSHTPILVMTTLLNPIPILTIIIIIIIIIIILLLLLLLVITTPTMPSPHGLARRAGAGLDHSIRQWSGHSDRDGHQKWVPGEEREGLGAAIVGVVVVVIIIIIIIIITTTIPTCRSSP